MKVNRCMNLILYSQIGFAISAFSFLLIPLSDFRGNSLQKTIAYLIGGLFWFGLAVGMIFTAILSRIRKSDSKKKHSIPGVLYFFKNKRAAQCDIAMIISLILLLIFQKLFGTYHMVSIILLSITLFTVYLHAVLNGSNYAYVMQKGVKK